jgi:pantoate--beta-alanine ligase
LDLIHTVAELRSRLAREPSVALVPTMGNLHDGHLALVREAAKRAPCVVASIFVNRLQFEPGSDFDRYPRTLERDCRLLEDSGCHVVFAPDEKEMYPVPQDIHVTPPRSGEQLCGDFRPGHFQGVTTVVAKLFNIVVPQVAVFGKKDYQQIHIIRQMVKQLAYGIEIVGVETVRESDGLAMSSRNGYLSRDERLEAMRLHQNLRRIQEQVQGGSRRYQRLEEMAASDLSMAGWKVDYVALRDRNHLAAPKPADRELVVLGAAWLGKTRLIDNVEIEIPAASPQ